MMNGSNGNNNNNNNMTLKEYVIKKVNLVGVVMNIHL